MLTDSPAPHPFTLIPMTLSTRQIGIFGGSFNPIHCGHIALARHLLTALGLDEIWFVESPQNPFKVQQQLLADDKRLLLVRKALAPYPQLVASDFEFSLPRPSYMWHTLQGMSAQWPDRELHLIIGADNWLCFDRWYHADDIRSTYPIIIYPRQGYDIVPSALPQGVRLVNTPLYNVSSTEIRADVAAGRDISSKVPSTILSEVEKEYK